MCRIFGFRSVIQSQVHRSLVSADNALGAQSIQHPDGWGVAYYVAGAPHVVKSATIALHDSLFRKVSGIVSSETVVAHIRKATQGQNTILNTHPFQYGRWVFAHNGNIRELARHRSNLLKLCDPGLRRFILGDTDSELIFYLLLSKLKQQVALDRSSIDVDCVMQAVQQALHILSQEVGSFVEESAGMGPEHNYFSFILTNGEAMVAHQGGKPLFYSTFKSRCSERDTCPYFAKECESASQSGRINHLVFSSEPLLGENIWIPMAAGQILGVDARMELAQAQSTEPLTISTNFAK